MTYNELKTQFNELLSRKAKGSISGRGLLALIKKLIEKIEGIDVSATATIRKSYNSLSEANADKTLIDPETNKPLKIGQLISVVADSDIVNNAIYRLSSIAADGTPTWERQAPLGDMSQYAKSGGSTKTAKDLEDGLEQLAGETTRLMKDVPFLRNGFPMALKGNILKNITVRAGTVGIGNVLSPSLFSDFLLDFKLQGVAESGYSYGISSFNNAVGGVYSYYIQISKFNEEGVNTPVANGYFSSNSSGVNKYEITPVSDETNVTKVILLLDWDAIKHIPGIYGSFYTAGYRFKNEYLFDSTTGKIAEDLAELNEQINIDNRIENAENIASIANGKLGTEDKTVFQLENDLNILTGSYGWRNIGQYTKKLSTTSAFNVVRLNGVRKPNTIPVDYKICVVNVTGGPRECPTGVISPDTHRIIKEGQLTFTNSYSDYIIKLDDVEVCPAGSQVVIFLSATDGKHIQMRGITYRVGNSEKTSNAALLSDADTPFDGGRWVSGSVNEETNIGYFNVALTLLYEPIFVTVRDLSQQINDAVATELPELLKSDLKLTIPDKVYAVVGTELNLWNDAVSLSVDKGLSSPLNYQVRWFCTKGLITDRCFRFTPTDSDVGTVSCTCYIYDMRGSLIDSKTFSIIVSAKNAIAAAKSIVYFGDSLGYSAAAALNNNFNNVNKFTGIIPIMQGTNGSTFGYEAVGGYGWKDYATAGRKAYRVFVTGVGSIELGSKYTNNGYTWTIVEVNVTDGNGNLLITTFAPQAYPDEPEINGTLTPVSTGVDITYTNASLMGANPLWNNDTNQLDIALYKTRIGLSPTDKIDAVSFQFGINDSGLADNLPTLMTYINDLYNIFTTDNPNCKFIIGLTTSAGNTVNGSGANYGASNDWMSYIDKVYRIRQFYLTLQNSAQYPNIIIAPISLGVDRYYGYHLGERVISQRVSIMEKYHTNHVHPTSSGYGQMADAYLGAYIYALTQ